LNDTDIESATQVGGKIRHAVRSSPLLRGDASIEIDVVTILFPARLTGRHFP
jgi:hypothetical protein